MVEYSNEKLITSESLHIVNDNQFSNPLSTKAGSEAIVLSEYTQEQKRPSYDEDISSIIEVVRILNNLAPLRMPIYNFNINEINGDAYYRPDGTLLLIREYDNDIVRDYYAVTLPDVDEFSVSKILEHDRKTGVLRTKIEPITREGSRLKTNITIFDHKINNKYTLIQLSDGGIVNNITEFSGKGSSFKTLFRNINNFKPARYLEGKETKNDGFEMLDCIFDVVGNIAKIKRYNKKKEISIDYKDNKKNITVKNIIR